MTCRIPRAKDRAAHGTASLISALVLAAAGLLAETPRPSLESKPPAQTEVVESRNGKSRSAIDAEVVRWSDFTASHPGDQQGWVRLGDALMQRSRDRSDPSFYDRAEAAYQRALKLDPRCGGALIGLAWVANSRHDFDAGRKWAREALAVDPRSPEPHALLGDAAVEAVDYEEALDQYQASLDLRPDLSSYSRAAHVLWLTGDSRRAQALMQKAIRAGAPHAENTAWCRAELALMMFQNGALVPAEQHLEAALRAAPDHPHVLEAMGRIKTANRDYPSAVDLYERALALAPRHSTMSALTDLYALTGEPQKAADMFKRVLELHAVHRNAERKLTETNQPPSPPHGHADLALFLADHDRDLDRALLEAEAAYQSSKNVYVMDALAWCYLKNGRTADAARMIRKALRWKTPDASILFHAGMIYFRMGDAPAAQKFLYQALNLNPHFHPLHAEMAANTLKLIAAARSASGPTAPAATPGGPPEASEKPGRMQASKEE